MLSFTDHYLNAYIFLLYSGNGSLLVTAFSIAFPVSGSQFSFKTAFNPSIQNVTNTLLAGGAMIVVTSEHYPEGVISGEIYQDIPKATLDK